MSLFSRFRGLRDAIRSKARSSAARTQTVRPRLESLEERLVPAFLGATDYGARVGEAVLVADFNGDGKLDLASVGQVKSSYAAGTISVQLGNGRGGFGGAKKTNLPLAPRGMAAADLNGDGKTDLVTTQGGNVSVLLGKGTGLFERPKNFALTNANGYSLAVADFDGDGKLDVAVTGRRIETRPVEGTVYVADFLTGVIDVFKGDGKGSLAAAQSFALPTVPYSSWEYRDSMKLSATAIGDFNYDGRPDLVTSLDDYWTDSTGSVFTLMNAGGSLAAPVAAGLHGHPLLAVGDMNGDHLSDLVTSAGVSLSNGDGTFQPAMLGELVALTQYENSITLADFNGDGKLDVATTVDYYLGNGDGTVQPRSGYGIYTSRGVYGGVAAGDFSGDGFTDLACLIGGGGSYWLEVYLNDGNW